MILGAIRARCSDELKKNRHGTNSKNNAPVHLTISSTRFLLYLLGKNIEPTTYTEVLEDFAAELPARQKNGALKAELNSA